MGGDCKYLSIHKDDQNLKMAVGDVARIEELKGSLKDVKVLAAVIHLAAVVGMYECLKNWGRAILTNVLGTLNVPVTAREHGGKSHFCVKCSCLWVAKTMR